MASNIFGDQRIGSFLRSYQLNFDAGTIRGAFLPPQNEDPLGFGHITSENRGDYHRTCRNLIQQANDLPINDIDRNAEGHILIDAQSWKACLYARSHEDHDLTRLQFEKVEQPYHRTSLLFLEEPPISQIVLYQENTRGVLRQTAIMTSSGDFFYQTFVDLYPTSNAFFKRWEEKIANLLAVLYVYELMTADNYEIATPTLMDSPSSSNELSGGVMKSNTHLPIPDLAHAGKITYTPLFSLDFLLKCGALQYLQIPITSTKPICVPGDVWAEIVNYIQGNNATYPLRPSTSAIE